MVVEATKPGYRVTKVKKFKGKYSFLSNFDTCEFEYQGREWKTLEHAYQASKTVVMGWRDAIQDASTPKQARDMGKLAPCRDNWDNIKLDIMEELLHIKFNKMFFRSRLVETGVAELIEGNWWHDNFWGDCSCTECKDIEGQNHLGKLLMKIREEL